MFGVHMDSLDASVEAATSAAPRLEPDQSSRYFNRELSWLDFNARVLAMAEDGGLPILERVKFLAIFSRNLDEFIQVRVGGLKEQVAAHVVHRSVDGMTAGEQLVAVRDRIDELTLRQQRCYLEEVVPALADAGVAMCDWEDLDPPERRHLRQLFHDHIYPLLTPLAFDRSHPFPYISNLSLNLAVVVRDTEAGATRLARVKVPAVLSRFITLAAGGRCVPVEQIIAAHLDELFPSMDVVEYHVFRVTRNADMTVEDDADDLLAAIETGVRKRQRRNLAVRLEVSAHMPEGTRQMLTRELRLDPDDVDPSVAPIDLGGLWSLSTLDRPDLKEAPWVGRTQPSLRGTVDDPPDIFAQLRRADVLVHHPYDSFGTSVEAFLEQAAGDPKVQVIKQTLYRTSGPDGPMMRALNEAAHAGKQVVALVEVNARFDEEANVRRARALEEAGVHVVYGVVGLKTHAKVSLVIRSEGGLLRRYAHVGTGNYNPGTATVYEDIGLLTCDPDLTADVADLFNLLTGYSGHRVYRKLLVAPSTLRSGLLSLIDREIERKGRIVIKVNSLVDPEIIDALIKASNEGVDIDLIVRGICCLRPGVPGHSDRITVRSIVGRYLEHSRVYRFGRDPATADYYIGSADLMPRNLDRRVEALAPITDPQLKARVAEVLDINLNDQALAWRLGSDGVWTPPGGPLSTSTHTRLQELALARAAPEGEPQTRLRPQVLVRAAGGVVVRRGRDGGKEVALVHRPAYSDWTFPKGKLELGETYEGAALREVEEETGHRCRLGNPLGDVEYLDRKGRPKLVRYWLMYPESGEFQAGHEVDAMRWASVEEALETLTYNHDRALLAQLTPRA